MRGFIVSGRRVGDVRGSQRRVSSRIAVGSVVIKKARFNELEVDDLTVHRLRVVEHKGPSA
jgi:hypothetical protein